MSAEEYELLPHEELQKLREEVEELKRNPMGNVQESEDLKTAMAKLTKAISNAGGNFVSFGQFSGDDPSSKIVTFKVAGLKKEQITTALTKIVKKFWDIRLS